MTQALTIGSRINIRRSENNMSIAKLSVVTGISKTSLYNYEKPIDSNIPTKNLLLLAKALYCSPNYLLGWPISAEDFKAGLYVDEDICNESPKIKSELLEMVNDLYDFEVSCLHSYAEYFLVKRR
jgi:transcriptional regulator with XRE-family HTH domain